MTKLYQIQACNSDGENQDLFVEAADPAQAFKLWEEYYSLTDAGAHDYTGELLPARRIPHERYPETDLRIWELPSRTGKPHALDWHSKVVVAAYKRSAKHA